MGMSRMVASDGQARGPVREGGLWECQLTLGLLVAGQSFSAEPGPGVNRLPWEQMLKQPALDGGGGTNTIEMVQGEL